MKHAAILVLGLSTVACAGNTDGQLASLEFRQQRIEHETRLDERRAAEIRAEVLRQRRRLVLVSACIEYSKCEAQRAKLESEVQRRLALCNADVAKWEACRANRMKRAAGGGVGLSSSGYRARVVHGRHQRRCGLRGRSSGRRRWRLRHGVGPVHEHLTTPGMLRHAHTDDRPSKRRALGSARLQPTARLMRRAWCGLAFALAACASNPRTQQLDAAVSASEQQSRDNQASYALSEQDVRFIRWMTADLVQRARAAQRDFEQAASNYHHSAEQYGVASSEYQAAARDYAEAEKHFRQLAYIMVAAAGRPSFRASSAVPACRQPSTAATWSPRASTCAARISTTDSALARWPGRAMEIQPARLEHQPQPREPGHAVEARELPHGDDSRARGVRGLLAGMLIRPKRPVRPLRAQGDLVRVGPRAS